MSNPVKSPISISVSCVLRVTLYIRNYHNNYTAESQQYLNNLWKAKKLSFLIYALEKYSWIIEHTFYGFSYTVMADTITHSVIYFHHCKF